jgi:serine/threonine protein phosphatase PrpC
VRSALLRGREHLEIGAIDAVAEGPAAIAISMGGAKKTYTHTDPNEDSVFFAVGTAGTLVAVADGHRGFEAAEVVLEHLLAHPGPQWVEPGGVTPASWGRHALAAICDANGEILRERVDTEMGKSRTTLSLALVLPESNVLLYACVGDSHLFQVSPAGVAELTEVETTMGPDFYLGHGEETPESLAEKCRIGMEHLEDTIAVVLASDGLSEYQIGVEKPEDVVQESVEASRKAALGLRPLEASRTIVEAALAAQRRNSSGDNVCAAVVWLEE